MSPGSVHELRSQARTDPSRPPLLAPAAPNPASAKSKMALVKQTWLHLMQVETNFVLIVLGAMLFC